MTGPFGWAKQIKMSGPEVDGSGVNRSWWTDQRATWR